MDGENNGSKPYVLLDDLGGCFHIFGNTHIVLLVIIGLLYASPKNTKAVQIRGT